MKRYIAGHVSIARLAALVLTALCVLQAPVRAQAIAEYIVIFPSVGLAPGQSSREEHRIEKSWIELKS
jgi:hypothetical protein